jgi:hypothetical protein
MVRKKSSTRTRRAVAAQAARLMAQDGLSEFGAAKRKAARQLGYGETEGLPSNEEVEAELRAYQTLYQNAEQRERLAELRGMALELMREFTAHRPHLTGSAWNGTAGRDYGLQIDLFTDAAKVVEMMLLGQGVAYRVEERPHFNRTLVRRIAVLVFVRRQIPVHLNLYTDADLRGALIADTSGAVARGNVAALELRMAEADSVAHIGNFLAAIR